MRTLDVPKLAKVEKIVQCPEEYKNILTFGVTCIIEKSTEFQLEVSIFLMYIFALYFCIFLNKNRLYAVLHYCMYNTVKRRY